MEKYIISALVQNNAGVLARVSSLFGRRGFNIDSLTVSPTVDRTVSRITIVVLGDEYTLEQVLKQVRKLEECIEVSHIDEEEAFCRELALIKIAGDEAERESVREVCALYQAEVVDSSKESIIVRVSGAPSKIDTFLSIIDSFHVVESSRTGITAVHKDKKDGK
ncbi:MAG: acetolactate synthase small subunit [Eubacteriales bacterium]|nr:acetolactate synthase small subunit [Eubacteriales bacterium]